MHWNSERNTVAISEEKTETFYYKSPHKPSTMPKGKAAGPAPVTVDWERRETSLVLRPYDLIWCARKSRST